MASAKSSPMPASSSLVEALSLVLPKGNQFAAEHLSTPPTATEPLCYPPVLPIAAHGGKSSDARPRKPLRTYCEKHFLAISIDARDAKDRVLVLGLEIYIYTTAHSSIIFVSKADSTGYLNLLKLPKGTPSPIREVTTAFISYLVENRRRSGVQFVVNLFARSQSQYLFPGSVKNNGKHVLDDRGLVKWWCRVLNPLLQDQATGKQWGNVHGYLIIPGLDDYETRAFLPRVSSASSSWTLGHPLEHISPYIADPVTYGNDIPARCLIPTYPDDPKARYVEELEESTSERTKLVSGWASPKTLAQFWEMMAFRQECSSGRLTGFIWLVYDPPAANRRSRGTSVSTRSSAAFIQTPQASFVVPSGSQTTDCLPSPELSQGLGTLATPLSTSITPKKQKKAKRVLKGRIVPRQPRVKTQQRAHFPKETETPYYFWPEEGRGQVVLDEAGYNRAVELLLHLEFGTLDQAIASTARWVNEVNIGRPWSLDITGRRETPVESEAGASRGMVNDISNMVKQKRLASSQVAEVSLSSRESGTTVNTLNSSLVRKKAKITHENSPPSSTETSNVNTLGVGLVRKKPKLS